MSSTSPAETGALLRILGSAPQRLSKLTSGWSERQLRVELAADEWPAAQLFAHIRASDDVLMYRCTMILAHDHPRYHGLDERRWEAVMHYADLDFAQSLHTYTLRRAELVQMLGHASPAGWRRSGTHAQRGEQSLWTVASHLSEHEEEHIAQMQSLVQRMRLLHAIRAGLRLKDHRDMDGHKTYLLHETDESSERVDAADVEALVNAGLISSNKKFPAATYWLTDAGRQLADRL